MLSACNQGVGQSPCELSLMDISGGLETMPHNSIQSEKTELTDQLSDHIGFDGPPISPLFSDTLLLEGEYFADDPLAFGIDVGNSTPQSPNLEAGVMERSVSRSQLLLGFNHCDELVSTTSPRGLEEWATEASELQLPLNTATDCSELSSPETVTAAQIPPTFINNVTGVFGPPCDLSATYQQNPDNKVTIDGQLVLDDVQATALSAKALATERRRLRKRKRETAAKSRQQRIDDLSSMELDIKKLRRVKNRASVEKCRQKQRHRIRSLECEAETTKEANYTMLITYQKLILMYSKVVGEVEDALGCKIDQIEIKELES